MQKSHNIVDAKFRVVKPRLQPLRMSLGERIAYVWRNGGWFMRLEMIFSLMFGLPLLVLAALDILTNGRSMIAFAAIVHAFAS